MAKAIAKKGTSKKDRARKPGRSKDPPSVSPELRSAIAADTLGCFVDDPVVGKSDVAVLKKILAGKLDPGFAVNTKRALGTLARSDPSAQTGEILGAVLADRKALPPDRAAAAAYLGLLPAKAAEAPLLATLGKTTGMLRVEVIKALTHRGTEKALKRLARLDPDKEDVARRQLALARLVIGFREAPEAAGPGELDAGLEIRWATAKARPLDAKAVKETIAALARPAFGIALDPDTGFRFKCGRSDQIVLLNAALKRGSIAKTLASRSLVAALIVTRPARVDHFNVRWLLLTSPEKNGVRMVLARPNGEAAFEGGGIDDGKGLVFALRDTGLERTPAEITGRIADNDVNWTIRTWQGPLRAKRSPLALTVPALV